MGRLLANLRDRLCGLLCRRRVRITVPPMQAFDLDAREIAGEVAADVQKRGAR